MDLTGFQNNIVDRLKEFSAQEPEIIFQWKDNKSSARGFLVINSLRGGAAGGGTRVHENITLQEVTALAKIMEIKFALSGPAIGGAKTGVKLDPAHPEKYAILSRWYKAITPVLKEYYGTGSDLNTDIHQINALLQRMGVNNSQQGIIHAITKGNDKLSQQAYENMRLLDADVVVGDQIVKLAELVTGFGVARAVTGFYAQKGQTVEGKRIFLQGVGNVGAAAAYYLQRAGGVIVAMSDRDAGVIRQSGFDQQEISQVLAARRVLNVVSNNLSHDEFQHKLVNTPVDVFVPAAGSNIVSKAMIDALIEQGLELICCGANHPFIETEYCYGLCSQYIDSKIAVIPDVLANMGMARTFYKLMTAEKGQASKELIFKDIEDTIDTSVENAYALNKGRLLTASVYDLALSRIEDPLYGYPSTTKHYNI
ncbi:Glu/Leu/Phe/Val dehydrogenase dimerization domain-containing protein [Facilibium subflavum]|uniref:Glu/Leu/Phe/Val dehydrogenase dimerization domain-containing protein n=1 Tax=Facilibium subflavum TaxID=2219058 RepID=UPI000E648FC9|nr:Glu/Leu/Phe/Val dehydrogenase dimerization domain-containing protein [Facilibium subflavum]